MKRLFFVCLILGLQGIAKADTLAELTTKVRVIINDEGAVDSRKYSDATIKNFLNEGMRRVVAKTKSVLVEYNITTSTLATNNEYSLPSDFVETDRVYIINKSTSNRESYTRIGRVDIDALDNTSLAWGDASRNRPSNYYIRETSSTVTIGVYPPVSTAYAGTDWLKVYYIPVITSMSATTDEPFNGLSYLEDYHYILVDYAVYRTTKNIEWLKVFDAQLTEMKSEVGKDLDQFGGGQIKPFR